MASYHLSVRVGKRGCGGSHADYVQREGAYKNYRDGEDLVHTESANLPSWAEHKPGEFFRQADLHERKNGSVYREFEIALPRELTAVQRIQFVREFVFQEIGNKHPVVWAIHNPSAAIEGGEQPHAHIMFCERTLDAIERGPEQFFKRYNSKAPLKGGCQKSNVFSGGLKSDERRTAIVGLRERFANLQNKHLKKHGHDTRVSHLSLAEQGVQRTPEKHLGPIASRDQKNIVLLYEYRIALQISDFHQRQTSTIDTTGSLSAALRERNEYERNRSAAFERIGKNLSAADNHSRQTESNFSSLGRSGEILTKAATDYRRNRAVREITQAIFRQLGRTCEEVTRATEHLAAIAKNRELTALFLSHHETSQVTPSISILDERKELEEKYSAQGVVQMFEHSGNAEAIGRIVEATNCHIITNLGRDHYAIHIREEFQCVDYDGSAIGEDRFAKGNLATFKYRENPEQRKAIIEELRPERSIKNDRDKGIGR